jgi:hypothetical protein
MKRNWIKRFNAWQNPTPISSLDTGRWLWSRKSTKITVSLPTDHPTMDEIIDAWTRRLVETGETGIDPGLKIVTKKDISP